MSRRPANYSRRYGDNGGGGVAGLFSFNSMSRSASYFPIFLILLGSLLLLAYLYRGSGGRTGNIGVLKNIEGEFSCTAEVQRAMPVLKKAYGGHLHKVLHVGPGTCSVVSSLRKEVETEAWGVEPYDIEDVDSHCRALIKKGIVRVSDVKFSLPYRPKSFSLVIVSDTLDYLSPRYLNKTLPDLARVSSEGLVIFTGFPGQHPAKASEASKFGRAAKLRSSSWWARYFIQNSLEENEAALKKFEKAAAKLSYKSSCQIFHLKAYT